jgi:hypothetical protein
MPNPHKPDPYCAFKNDVERRKALLSRDVRLVLVAAILGGAGLASSLPWREAALWLRHLLG